MGRINLIWEPLYWKIELEGINKNNPNDIIYKMIIGEGEDNGYYEITEYISKTNYEKVLNHVYNIEKFPYSEIPILLFDEERCLIPLVKNTDLDLEKLSFYQREIINKICIKTEENKKKIKRK